jgi:hypothetical protein
MIFLQSISKEILPEKEGLLVVRHPGYNKIPKRWLFPFFNFERNKESKAYVPYWKKSYYFMGGFNGGKTENYLKLIDDLANNIKIDLDKNIIARWHDESHLNSYLIRKKKKILNPDVYANPEGKKTFKKPRIMILDKSKLGGHNYLRENENN